MRCSEHEEQVAVIQWCDWNKNRFPGIEKIFAIPNGAKAAYRKLSSGKSFSPEGQKLKREGRRSGVPDLELPLARGGYFGLFIEMKAEGGKVDQNQDDYIRYLNHHGYLAVACWGSEEAINVLEWYCSLPPTEPKCEPTKPPFAVWNYEDKSLEGVIQW